ncbi:hypothetical protein FB451DRAFT_1566034 [Mycena latifolia]|nr:hypothetical protein FB451DRAFT_1566034 [Mycena latifolia]
MFADNPDELLDHILSFVPETHDLVPGSDVQAPARHHHPRPPQFRVVQCDPRRVALWQALTENKTKAASIVTLELLDESPLSPSSSTVLVPRPLAHAGCRIKCLSHDADAAFSSNCTEALATTLSRMCGLTRLCVGGDFFGTHPIEPIFSSVLENCPNLRELEITYHDEDAPRFDTISAPLWEFRNLRRVSVTVTRSFEVTVPAYTHFRCMLNMLSKCRHLQDLRLAFAQNVAFDVSHFLQKVWWPNLKRLILEGDLRFAWDSAWRQFLYRHSGLEVLSIAGITSINPLPLMPNFRWLSTPVLQRTICNAATQFPRLESIVTADACQSDTTLRSTTLWLPTFALLEELSRTLPHLERLTLAGAPWNPHRTSRHTKTLIPSPECIGVLAKFKCLTHLDSAAALVLGPDPELHDATLRSLLEALAQALPQLRYVGIDVLKGDPSGRSRPANTWYVLTRDLLGSLVAWRETRALREARFHDWEDVFRHIGISH